jgi:hypothetical protein
MVPAIRALKHADLRVRSLQHHHALQRQRAEG